MMAPASVPSAAQPPEIQFAQRLAANEKKIRDRALKKLRGYIALRTRSPADGFSEEELLKIWKGLFYCMWMQDKPLLQEELSSNISKLIHIIEDMEARHLFIQTFWQTMNREWNGIDRLRLDKFYTLMRMMLRESFEVLKRNEWNESFSELLLNLLMKEVIHSDSKSPVGVKLHFIDIYLEELAKVGAKELTADQNLKFLDPFCKTVAKTKDHFLLQAIIHGIFEAIVDQSPFAIEDLMNELEAGSDDDFSDEEWSEESKLIAKGKKLLSKSPPDTDAQEGLQEDSNFNIGPVLQFDYKMVADTLFELASRKNTPVYNRKHIYKVVKKFQDLAEGSFPQDDFPEDVSTDEDDDTFSRGKWKRKSGKPLNKTKLEKEENSTNRQNGVEEVDANTGLQKRRKKRKKKSRPVADSCTDAGSNEREPDEVVEPKDLNQDSKLPNTKKSKKKRLSMEANKISPISELDETAASESLTCLVGNLNKQPKKKNCSLRKVPIDTIHQNGQADDTCTEDDPGHCAPAERDSKVMKKKRKVESGIVTENGFSEQTMKQQPEKESLAETESTTVQKLKLKQKYKLRNGGKNSVFRQRIVSLKKKRKIKEVLNPVEESELAAEIKKSKNDETTGTVPLLKKKTVKAGNDFVKFEKKPLPKPVFFRKAKGSITSMQLSKLQSSNSKKVTFGLNKNMTAEFKKTDKSILVSPEGASRVAFNPEQKPHHGVLKSSLGSPSGTPLLQKSSLMSTKKRPTAMDFF